MSQETAFSEDESKRNRARACARARLRKISPRSRHCPVGAEDTADPSLPCREQARRYPPKPPCSRYASSCAVLSRPSTRFRCGKRPKRWMMSR